MSNENLLDSFNNKWDGLNLAKKCRKNREFDKARKILDKAIELYPNFKALKTEELWLEYNEIFTCSWKDAGQLDLESEILLEKIDKNNQYERLVYIKTVLKTSDFLIYTQSYKNSFDWLTKIDHKILSNKEFVVENNINGDKNTYPSDKQKYFLNLSKCLIELKLYLNFLDYYTENLKFSEKIKNNFKIDFEEYVDSSYNKTNYFNGIPYGTSYVERKNNYRLAKFIETVYQEIDIRTDKLFLIRRNFKETTKVSDLSHFVFCPVRYSINKTYNLNENKYKDQGSESSQPMCLEDMHALFRRCQSIEETFKYTDINLDNDFKNKFKYILNSKIVINNSNKAYKIFTNTKNSIIGAPDYVLSTNKGTNYVIIEKFSKYDYYNQKSYKSDLIKIKAYLEKFESLGNLNLRFGLLITWFWDNKKKIEEKENEVLNIAREKYIIDYKIDKVERNELNKQEIDKVLQEIKMFDETGIINNKFSKRINPKKCLKCSAFKYCNHKTGQFDSIKIPYKIDDLKVNFKKYKVSE